MAKKKSFSKKLRYERERRKQKDLASNRISSLFELAEKVHEKDKSLSKRYVEIAKKISTKYNTKIPSELKRKFCKKCGSFLKQGSNVTVRLHNSKLIYHCHECGAISRFGYKSKNREMKELKKRIKDSVNKNEKKIEERAQATPTASNQS